MVAKALVPLNAKGASVVLYPPGWLRREKAKTIAATTTAIRPVR